MQNIHNQLEKFQDATYFLLNKSTNNSDWQKPLLNFFIDRKLRKGRAQQTLFNLALAMLCSWVIFLVGIKQTYHFIGCLIVAILLHYFILASFMWMLMEAFLQYLTFVKVLGTYVTRYTLKSVIAAWGESTLLSLSFTFHISLLKMIF